MGSALSSNIRDTLEFRVNRSPNILLAVLGKSRRPLGLNDKKRMCFLNTPLLCRVENLVPLAISLIFFDQAICAKLPLMRWRSGIGLGITIAIAFLAMVATPVRPYATLLSHSSASVASIPGASVRLAAAAQIVQSNSGGGHSAHNKQFPGRASELILNFAGTVQIAETAGTIDGPLHRRPPPSFS